MTYHYQYGVLKERMSKLAILGMGLLFACTAALSTLAPAGANSHVQPVYGNTVDVSAGENGSEGWWFNRDQKTKTPYEFTTTEASIGNGSLYVKPIQNNYTAEANKLGNDKFIAENFSWSAVSEVDSISYDFYPTGTTTPTSYKQFYLNVYAILPDSPDDRYYDCRYDYVPTSGINEEFNTATFATDATPTRIAGTDCPSTLAGMDDGSRIRAFAISVGDTSVNDTGLAGYLDNVVIAGENAVTYDFEPSPSSKNDCKKGGWETYGFRNQGQCVSYVNTGRDSR